MEDRKTKTVKEKADENQPNPYHARVDQCK
jgi:hypothetical protein